MRAFLFGVAAAVLIASAPAEVTAAALLEEVEVQAILTSQQRRVRPVDRRISQAIAEGLRRSATFARLVLALNRSDVIVYVETAPGMPSTLAGRMMMAAGRSQQRYLRIQITGAVRGNELIALLGHELQHALEVADSPTVRDERSLSALYETIGQRGLAPHRFDTLAAQNAGRQVRMELIG